MFRTKYPLSKPVVRYYNYLTTNLLTKKRYVGSRQTTKDIDKDSYLGGGIYLINSIKKYGKENFIKKILCTCEDRAQSYINERTFIFLYNTLFPKGYNISPTGGVGSPGMCANSTRQKIRKANLGKKHSEEHKRKNREGVIQYYIEHPEARQKARETVLKRYKDPKERLKQERIMKAVMNTPEMKEKLSKITSNFWKDPKWKRNQLANNPMFNK